MNLENVKKRIIEEVQNSKKQEKEWQYIDLDESYHLHCYQAGLLRALRYLEEEERAHV